MKRTFRQKKCFCWGVDERGSYLAAQLHAHLLEISPLRPQLIASRLLRAPGAPHRLETELPLGRFAGQALVVVDDVLYTGSTLLQFVAGLLPGGPRSIQTAVLIDRGHRLFPVDADVVGRRLATTIQEHISFEFDPASGRMAAFLQ